MSRGRCGRDSTRRENGFEQQGGYMAAKRAKLAHQFATSSSGRGRSSLFSGVRIFVNGITEPPASILKQIMRQHGGEFHFYLKRRGPQRTTHVIASNICRATWMRSAGLLVVKPQWISACLEKGERVGCEEYRLSVGGVGGGVVGLLKHFRQECDQGEETAQDGETCSAHHDDSGDGIFVDDEYGEDGGDDYEDESEVVPDSPGGLLDAGDCTSGGCGFQSVEKADHSSQTSSRVASDPIEKSDRRKPAGQQSSCSSAVPITSEGSLLHKKAGDPGFLQEYFANSRLHHISEMKAMLIDYVASLQHGEHHEYPAREALKLWCSSSSTSSLPSSTSCDHSTISCDATVIAHIDLDCFFVSVGRLTRPHLVGLPVAVTHCRRAGSTRTSDSSAQSSPSEEHCSSMAEVASCSYEARAAGVRNGMTVRRAVRLCPQLRTMPYDFAAYRRTAMALYVAVGQLERRIEALSCDELLVDCGDVMRATGTSSQQLAAFLRHHVASATGGCRVSVGMGPSVLVARLATRRAKPDGQCCVEAAAAADFVAALPLDWLPGVGAAAAEALRRHNCRTCGDVRQLTQRQLTDALGAKLGRCVYDECRGLCRRRSPSGQHSSVVRPLPDRRSVSVDVNYAVRFECERRLTAFIDELCGELAARASAARFAGRRMTLRVMVRRTDAPVTPAKFLGHGLCDTFSRSGSLASSSSTSFSSLASAQELSECARRLWHRIDVRPREVRGLAVQVATLGKGRQSVGGEGRGGGGCLFNRSPAKQLAINRMFAACKETAASAVRQHSPPPSPLPPTTAGVEEVLRRLGVDGVGGAQPTNTAQLRRPAATPLFYGSSDERVIARLIADWLNQGENDHFAADATQMSSATENPSQHLAPNSLQQINPLRSADTMQSKNLAKDSRRGAVCLSGASIPSRSSPRPSDVRALARYLAALVDAWQLPTAERHLQLLRRRISRQRSADSCWRAAVEEISGVVQARVRVRYGGAQLCLHKLPIVTRHS